MNKKRPKKEEKEEIYEIIKDYRKELVDLKTKQELIVLEVELKEQTKE